MEKIEWIVPNIKNIDRLHQKNDFKALIYIMFYIVLLSITGGLSYYFINTGDYFLASITLFFHGTFFSFLGWSGIGHELVHYSVFKTKLLNSFFLKLFALLTWNNYVFFKESHTKHHKYTLYDQKDREIVMPLTPEYDKWIYLFTFNIPFFYKNIKVLIENSLGKINGIWGNELFPYEEKEKRLKLFNFARFILIGHVVLATLFIVFEMYPLLLLVTFAPFIGNWLNRMLAISQHINMQGNINDFRRNSTTIRLNWFLSTLYSNMNYHIEHHLYPQVPFYNLPQLSKELDELHFLPKPIIGLSNVIKHVTSNTKVENVNR